MGSTDFLSAIVNAFVEAMQPLTDALQSVDGVGALLSEFGWGYDDTQSASSYTTPFSAIQSEINNLQAFAANPDAATFIAALGPLVSAVNALPSGFSGSGVPYPLSDPTFQQTFPVEVFDFLIVRYMQESAPRLYAALSILKIVDAVPIAATATRGAHIRRSIDWQGLYAALGNPAAVFTPTGPFGWGSAAFDVAGITRALSRGLAGFGVRVLTYEPERALAETYYGTLLQAQSQQVMQSVVPLFSAIDMTGAALATVRVNVGALPIPPAGAPSSLPDGLVLFLDASGSFSESFTISPVLTGTVGGKFSETGGLRVELHPGSSQVSAPLLPAGTSLSASMTLTAAQPGGGAWVLIGTPTADRVQVEAVHLKIGAVGTIGSAGGAATATFTVELGVDQGAVYIDLSQGDGFISTILGSEPQSIQGSFAITWSNVRGLTFDGQAQLSAVIPLHVSMAGILDVDSLTIGLAMNSDADTSASVGIALNIGITGSLTLGPLAISVDNIGVVLALNDSSTPPSSNTVRLPDVGFRFKPPDGLGIALDSPGVSGGGFLSFSTNQYAGGVDLTIEELQLKAFGVLDTTLPDGSPGYSFVIIVSADFPPIELGFGFALSGVGGLLGVNRSMALDPLRAAFRAHTLDDIVFLKGDIVSQAPTLLQGIAAIFPPLDAHFVIGPFVIITWSDPPLLTAELGIIISLPDPVTLAILGDIVVAVPDPDDALILLNLDVLGTWDCDAKQIAIDASLYDSYVAAFTVAGDMAFRLNYGDSPSFALSVGGLNPQFQPPPKFPTLKRMSISLGDGGNPGISVQGYFAVTSNSLQFGAIAVLTAEASGFGVHGSLSFDVLIVFNPFGFTIDLHAELDVLSGGSVVMSIHLDGLLSGPTPWHIHGDASFSILFFSVSVNIDASFGQSAAGQNPPLVPTIPPFQAALQDPRNWSATLPQDAGRVATLVAAPTSNDAVLVHPLGRIAFQQTVVPLNLTISKFGNAVPSDATLFSVTGVSLNGAITALGSTNAKMGEFADGQFLQMSDQDKLSKPSYTLHAAGAEFTSGAIHAPSPILKDVVYDTIVEDDPIAGPTSGLPYQPLHSTVVALSGTGASANSPRRQAGAQRYLTPGLTSAVTTNAEAYVIVSALTQSVRDDIVPVPGGYYEVQEALRVHLTSHPGDAQSLLIVATYELSAVA